MTLLYLVPTGMNDPGHPSWGSWAGRYGPKGGNQPYYWANQADVWQGSTNRDNTLRRWAIDLQNDFKARMDWCVKAYAQANHPPSVVVRGPSKRTVSSGTFVALDASGSRDPDGGPLSYQWFIYREAGTYTGPLAIDHNDSAEASFLAPSVASPETLHIILRVTDHGEPPLSRYQRVIIQIEQDRRP